jgi:hypothetical protein
MPARHDRAADDWMRAIRGARKRPRESHGTKISNSRYYKIKLDSRFDVLDRRGLHTSSRFSWCSVYSLCWYKSTNIDAGYGPQGFDGDEFYLKEWDALVGKRFGEIHWYKSTNTDGVFVQKYHAARRSKLFDDAVPRDIKKE